MKQLRATNSEKTVLQSPEKRKLEYCLPRARSTAQKILGKPNSVNLDSEVEIEQPKRTYIPTRSLNNRRN